eukprot:jgi/Chlat1/6333/Chrsp44S05892
MAAAAHCAAGPSVSSASAASSLKAASRASSGSRRAERKAAKKAGGLRSGFLAGERLIASAASAPAQPRCCKVSCTAEAVASADASAPAFLAWKNDATVKKREDIKTVMVLGAGPIVIGQACEFDYSGTQACKALKGEGYRVVLINSNPATIMTDPETADSTYVTPMTPQLVEKIIERERPDAILPTMGGQTALNLAVALSEQGILDKYNVELIGAKLDAIRKAEDRLLFQNACNKLGIKSSPSGIANTMEDAWAVAAKIGEYPLIIRPAFTLGGTGGGIAYNPEEFEQIINAGLTASLTSQVLVEKSLLGWKEYELEVMRDLADNVVIICSIENIDPMGVHTGDSVTLAPAQTLTDKEYQRLRDMSVAIIREIGVECGGSNVQFAVNPADGEVMIIEMNPRVSRSSALASKATGFPIAKMAAKLSIGYTLDQIPNDITKKTPASFEPSIDYVVTKIPRFAFEKFPGSQPILTTQMKSVGEAMAVGRTFQESFQKAMRSLEVGVSGWVSPKKSADRNRVMYNLRNPNPDRFLWLHEAMVQGMSNAEIHDLTKMDPWFLTQWRELFDVENFLRSIKLEQLTSEDMWEAKRRGFSDEQIASFVGAKALEVRARRKELGVVPIYKRVDTCAAEFEAETNYMYSCYDYGECEANTTSKKKVLILGGGPNRIGQGIEFDYCCCHAAFSLAAAGFETIMMNSNPETVSTDYDTSDRLYFEPLTVEDVLNVIELERPDGIIVQFGGQTPLKLAVPLKNFLDQSQLKAASGLGVVKIWGTSPESIDAAEDRDQWYDILNELNIRQPPGGMATSEAEALAVAQKVGYPVMVRPSYVLGGRAMEIVSSDERLKVYLETAVEVDPERPVLIDQYLDDATEIDVDCLADSEGNVVIGGIMEHIEQAGVHSGDSACSIPTQTVSDAALKTIREWTVQLAKRLQVVGLMNIQYAVLGDTVYILEANPRASRTVPFVSKAIGHPLAKYASLLMSGLTLKDLDFEEEVIPKHVAVKEAVLPFDKFPGADTLLGPEMRSTGEVMGIDTNFAMAFAKAQLAANQKIPLEGTVFIAMNDKTKQKIVPVAKGLVELGFKLVATSGTATVLYENGVECSTVLKIHEGRPNAGDLVTTGKIQMMIITSSGDERDLKDGRNLRRLALAYKVPLVTTVAAANATLQAIQGMKAGPIEMTPLQDFFNVEKAKEAVARAAELTAA